MHKAIGMNTRGVVRVVMILFTVVATGCNDLRQPNPAAASLFTPSVQGIWSGPMTLLGTSGGECVVGDVIPTFLPTLDTATFTLSPNGDTLNATITTESSGLACRYTGTASGSTVALNATSCDRTGLVVICANGVPRELKLLGSSVTASWNGTQIFGRVTSTYNVFTTTDIPPIGVGSLVATHDFTATRR